MGFVDWLFLHPSPSPATQAYLRCPSRSREVPAQGTVWGCRPSELPAPIKDWEVIEATAEEAHSLGCNTLCLEPGAVIIGAEHKRLIKEIEKREVLVVAVPFYKPLELGGGIRCSTHPLLREA